MSECKACRSEIDPRATKCPRCQAFQRWYRNPQIYSYALAVPFLVFTLWQLSWFKSEDFTGYRSQFSTDRVADLPGEAGSRVMTYRIGNATSYKWEHLRYELVGLDDKGKVVFTQWGSDYSWLVQPRGEAFVSVEAKDRAGVSSWDFRIASLETARF